MTTRSALRLSGLIWLLVGIFLMSLGCKFLAASLHTPSIDKFSFLQHSLSAQTTLLWVLVCALAVGHLKGRFVFKRTVQRQIARIESLPKPIRLLHLYGAGYYILILAMMGLGILMRFLPIALDVRGAVDLTVGSALIQGSLHYFRAQPLAT